MKHHKLYDLEFTGDLLTDKWAVCHKDNSEIELAFNPKIKVKLPIVFDSIEDAKWYTKVTELSDMPWSAKITDMVFHQITEKEAEERGAAYLLVRK